MSESSAAQTVERLRSELNRVLDAVWTQGEKAYETLNRVARGESWSPAVDVLEDADHLRVLVDLPGCDPATIAVSLLGNRLTIKGEKFGQLETSPAPQEASAGGCESAAALPIVHRRTRPCGSFEVDLPLPRSVENESVSATSHWGVLTISLRKKAAVDPQPVQVPVQVSTPG